MVQLPRGLLQEDGRKLCDFLFNGDAERALLSCCHCQDRGLTKKCAEGPIISFGNYLIGKGGWLPIKMIGCH